MLEYPESNNWLFQHFLMLRVHVRIASALFEKDYSDIDQFLISTFSGLFEHWILFWHCRSALGEPNLIRTFLAYFACLDGSLTKAVGPWPLAQLKWEHWTGENSFRRRKTAKIKINKQSEIETHQTNFRCHFLNYRNKISPIWKKVKQERVFYVEESSWKLSLNIILR